MHVLAATVPGWNNPLYSTLELDRGKQACMMAKKGKGLMALDTFLGAIGLIAAGVAALADYRERKSRLTLACAVITIICGFSLIWLHRHDDLDFLKASVIAGMGGGL
jgi:MFS-type transporter involved in bile tolerance (Atg22 family)